MKSIKFFALSMFLFTVSVNAQITKGNWMVGGNASFSSQETYSNKGMKDNISQKTVQLKPNLGYFLIDKFAIGARLGYEGTFFEDYGYGATKSNSFFVGPFVRYYFLKPEKVVNVFVENSYTLGETYYRGAIEYQNNSRLEKTYSFMAGPVVYFNSSVSMEFTLQYSSTDIKSEEVDLTNNKFQVGLGLQIYLEKNK
jgi:hypothetical protein